MSINRVAPAIFLVALCLAVLWFLTPAPSTVEAGIDLQQALSDSGGDFAEVVPGRDFSFPADHGAHPGFKTEWWYFTGHLFTQDDRRFGYQVTLFRVGLPGVDKSENPSAWTSDAIFMGHLALSDPKHEKFRDFERFSRVALGLAGVEGVPPRVWLEDWSISRSDDGWSLKAGVEGEDGFLLDLNLRDTKPPVLQGEGGYSRKGPLSQHASYYVSQTRLATSGLLEVSGERLQVEGSSWFDHEWSSEAMAEGLVGWDWFSLQLDDDTELMLYLLRYDDGRLESASSGALIDAQGKKHHLALSDFAVESLATHRSPSGRVYPSRWRVEVPSEKLTLEVVPTMADQEMTSGVPYWEGAVTVKGARDSEPVAGNGFVELTGYK